MEIIQKPNKSNRPLIAFIFILIVALLVFLILSLTLEKNAIEQEVENMIDDEVLIVNDNLENGELDLAEMTVVREQFIIDNINEISPEGPVLGGTFYVLSIDWLTADKALVSYEDGHIYLEAEVDFVEGTNEVGSVVIVAE